MPHIDLGPAITNVVNWLINNFGGVFDAISSVLTSVVSWLTSVLTAPAPLVMVAILVVIALAVANKGVAIFALLSFSLVDGMQLWTTTMQTLAVVVVASAIAALIAIPLGIWCATARVVDVVTRPMMDLMQTLPAYVYLIPAVFFFGVGLVPAVVATAIFAIPPAVRLTSLGIRQVDPELVEAGRAFGARRGQILREIQIPLALPSIMAGVNQVIMLALSMVVIAGLVGAGGLGEDVVTAVTQLQIGTGVEAGLAVVFLAVYLDRVSAALGRGTASLPICRLVRHLQRARRGRERSTSAEPAI